MNKIISNNITTDLFEELYRDEKYILVKNINSESQFGYGPYSFGLIEDFYSFYSFPVNQSCLHKNEIIKTLNTFIDIEKQYIEVFPSAKEKITIWKNMIKLVEIRG